MKPQNINWRRYHDGSVVGLQSLNPVTERKYGLPHLQIHRWDYQKILYEEAVRLGVEIRLGTAVSGFDTNCDHIHLGSGEVLKADLIVGSDGTKSLCRDRLSGYKATPTRSGEVAIRLTLSMDAIRDNQDTKDLLETCNFDTWMGPHAHVVSYWLGNRSQFNMVLTQPDSSDDDSDLDFSLKPLDTRLVETMFEDWDPKLRALLSMARSAKRSALCQTEELGSWVDGSNKLVLLGDAVHPMLPYLLVTQSVNSSRILNLRTEHKVARWPLKTPLFLQLCLTCAQYSLKFQMFFVFMRRSVNLEQPRSKTGATI